MPWISVVGAVAGGALGLLGAQEQAGAAREASGAQLAATREQMAEARRQYDLSRADALAREQRALSLQAPFLGTGTAANQRLAYLMGLEPTTPPALAQTAAPAAAPIDRDAIRQRLLPQFTSQGAAGGGLGLVRVNARGAEAPTMVAAPGIPPPFEDTLQGALARQAWEQAQAQPGAVTQASQPGTPVGPTIDEAGLQAAIDAEVARMQAAQAGAVPGAATSATGVTPTQKGPDFGALTRRATTTDIEADPVYQMGLKFGLEQGTGAINARAIAGGGYDSGATLKALTRYANDYGTTKAEGAYGRYVADQTNLYNRLAGLGGSGQTAANVVGQTGLSTLQALQGAGQQYGGATNEALAAAGNARAAGIVGGANAWNQGLGGVNQAYNNYQNQQWLNKLLGGGGRGGFNPNTSYNMAGNYQPYYTGYGAAGDYQYG
jgi:hypothetical protein